MTTNHDDNRMDIPDDDVLEEFEEIGAPPPGAAVKDSEKSWTQIQHLSWDDADLDDTFTEKLDAELRKVANEISQ